MLIKGNALFDIKELERSPKRRKCGKVRILGLAILSLALVDGLF